MAAVPGLPDGYRLAAFEEIDSTNAEALRRVEKGDGPGTVIWARRQTAGRGRRGRQWQSPAGNLYATLIAALPPDGEPGHLAFLAALAAGEAVGASLPPGRHLSYKWPNDLMLEGAKLGGILIEAGRTPDGATLYAVGLGINVASAPDGAAYLDATGARTTVEQLLFAVCRAYARWMEVWSARGFAPLRAAWLAGAHGLGGAVTVRFPDGSAAHGLFRDIDERGALLLDQPEAGTRRIAAGEVFFAAA